MLPVTDAFVGFDETAYQVSEGNILLFCVEVVDASHSNCVINFPFNISVSTMPGGRAGNL